MNNRGMFAFLLAVMLAAMLVSLQAAAQANAAEFQEALGSAVEAEEAAFIRTVLEEGFDNIVEGTLEEELAAGNHDAGDIRAKIVRRTTEFIEEAEKRFGGAVAFHKPADLLDVLLEENRFIVILLPGDEPRYAMFILSNSLTEKSFLRADIRVGKAGQVFEVPPNYTVIRGEGGVCPGDK